VNGWKRAGLSGGRLAARASVLECGDEAGRSHRFGVGGHTSRHNCSTRSARSESGDSPLVRRRTPKPRGHTIRAPRHADVLGCALRPVRVFRVVRGPALL